MSYEGYDEYITHDGYYFVKDIWDDLTEKEKKDVGWWHPVDLTNGFDPDHPYATGPAPKTVMGWEDILRFDHYNNEYYVKRLLYAPDFEHWRVYDG